MSQIVITGLQDTLSRLDVMKGARLAIGPAAKHIKQKISRYPARMGPWLTRKQVYGTSFKSAKQRRYVMMLIRSGKVPYRQTGSLGRSWAMNISLQSLQARIGNSRPYAPYVQGGVDSSPTQSLFMKSRHWKTTDKVAEEETQTVKNFFVDYINKQLSGGK